MGIDRVTEYGFEGFESNEQTIGSLKDDPAKLRITVHITEHGGGGGVVSFNASRLSGVPILGANQLEMGYLRVEQSEAVRGQVGNLRAELNVFLNDGSGEDDAAMVRAFAMECDRITKIHPGLLQSLRALVGSGGSSSSRFASGNGLYLWNYQDDGAVVLYDTHGSSDETTWTPCWAQRRDGSVESFV